MSSSIVYHVEKADERLADVVDSLWMLTNPSPGEKAVVVVPDGRVDILFSCAATEPYHVTLAGLGSKPSRSRLAPQSVMFGISFNLLALEYLLDTTVADMVDHWELLPNDFWSLTSNDLTDFDHVCQKATQTMLRLVRPTIDPRKQKLFRHLYATNGNATVTELAEASDWSPRQINRYFTQRFGLSLKAYCTILRFRASFGQLKSGKLFPEQNFADQSHFIHDVKKFAGVSPKELARNEDDRFIQFSTLPPK